MKIRRLLSVLLLSSAAFAGVFKVVSYPVRHPKKSGKAVFHVFSKVAHKAGHVSKKVVF